MIQDTNTDIFSHIIEQYQNSSPFKRDSYVLEQPEIRVSNHNNDDDQNKINTGISNLKPISGKSRQVSTSSSRWKSRPRSSVLSKRSSRFQSGSRLSFHRRRSSTDSVIELSHSLMDNRVPKELREKIIGHIHTLKKELRHVEEKVIRRERNQNNERKKYFKELMILREELFRKKKKRKYSPTDYKFLNDDWKEEIAWDDDEEEMGEMDYDDDEISEMEKRRIEKQRRMLFLEKKKFFVDKAKRLVELKEKQAELKKKIMNLEIMKNNLNSLVAKNEESEKKLKEEKKKVSELQVDLFTSKEKCEGQMAINEKIKMDLMVEKKIYEKFNAELNVEVESKREVEREVEKEHHKLKELKEQVGIFMKKLKNVEKVISEKNKETSEKKEVILMLEKKKKELEKTLKERSEINSKKLRSMEKRKKELEHFLKNSKHLMKTKKNNLGLDKEEEKMKKIDKEIENFKGEFLNLSNKITVASKRFKFYQEENKEAVMTSRRASINDNAPSGEVALAFTDVESSTALWEESVEVMSKSMKIHNIHLRKIIKDTQGYEVKTEGDAFMVAFGDVKNAIRFAMRAQLELMNLVWPKGLAKSKVAGTKRDETGKILYRGLVIRIGLHVGNPIAQRDPTTGRMDYFGPVVNKSARVEATACGGSTSISGAVRKRIKKILNGKLEDQEKEFGCGVFCKSIGVRVMKGMGSEEIFYLFPESLKERWVAKKPPVEQKNREKTLLDMIKTLQEKKSDLENKRGKITDYFSKNIRLKSLKDSNKEKDNMIGFLQSKIRSIKRHYEGKRRGSRSNTKDEIITDQLTEMSNVMDKYKNMVQEQEVLSNKFGTIEKVFEDRLKNEIGHFSLVITDMKSVLERTEKKNEFERSMWEHERKLYQERIKKFMDEIKEKEKKIKLMEDENQKNDGNGIFKQGGNIALAGFAFLGLKSEENQQKEGKIRDVSRIITKAVRYANDISEKKKQNYWEDHFMFKKEDFFVDIQENIGNMKKSDKKRKKRIKRNQNNFDYDYDLDTPTILSENSITEKSARLEDKIIDDNLNNLENNDEKNKIKNGKSGEKSKGGKNWKKTKLAKSRVNEQQQQQDDGDGFFRELQDIKGWPRPLTAEKNNYGYGGKRMKLRKRPVTVQIAKRNGGNIMNNQNVSNLTNSNNNKKKNKIKRMEELRVHKMLKKKKIPCSYSRLLQKIPRVGKKDDDNRVSSRISKFKKLSQLVQRNGMSSGSFNVMVQLKNERENLLEKLYFRKNAQKYHHIISKQGTE